VVFSSARLSESLRGAYFSSLLAAIELLED